MVPGPKMASFINIGTILIKIGISLPNVVQMRHISTANSPQQDISIVSQHGTAESWLLRQLVCTHFWGWPAEGG